MIGIVACRSLYPELEKLAPDAAVRYVPPELAEFPVNVPTVGAITDQVQAAIDDLETQDQRLDRILTLYPNGNGELSGIETAETPLFVTTVDDAISLFIHEVEPWTMGEPKEFGTYYLSRGWIDAGIDAYKLYTSYVEDRIPLETAFEQAMADHDDLRVTWPEGERYRRALERDLVPSPDLAGRFFHEVLRYYERVKFVDTGVDVYDVHWEYAQAFRRFIEELKKDHGNGGSVDLVRIAGDDSMLRSFLQATDDTPPYLETCQPGESF